MSEIHVSPGQIRTLAGNVNQGSENLNQIVGQLTNAFNSSDGFWRGQAREQFTQAFGEWNAAWGKMHESLQQMQGLIKGWVDKAEELDRSVQRS